MTKTGQADHTLRVTPYLHWLQGRQGEWIIFTSDIYFLDLQVETKEFQPWCVEAVNHVQAKRGPVHSVGKHLLFTLVTNCVSFHSILPSLIKTGSQPQKKTMKYLGF